MHVGVRGSSPISPVTCMPCTSWKATLEVPQPPGGGALGGGIEQFLEEWQKKTHAQTEAIVILDLKQCWERRDAFDGLCFKVYVPDMIFDNMLQRLCPCQ